MDEITGQQIRDAGLVDWRPLMRGLHARFDTGSFTAGLRFVTAITEAAEAANHHPDVTLTYPTVSLRLISHDVGRLTRRDLELAARISQIARDQGINAQPDTLAELTVALDTADVAAAAPFWAALLTGDPGAVADNLIEPGEGLVPLWFQGTDPHAVPRQRFHLDVWVPQDVAQARITAALGAGGTLVDDSRAPGFTVLADPEGNRACVCTAAGR